METAKAKKLATDIFNKIKKILTDTKKANKELEYPYGWGRKAQQVELGYDEVQDSVFDKATNQWKPTNKTYEIYLEGKAVVKGLPSRFDLEDIFKEIGNLLNEQKKVKGWGGLVYEFENVTIGFSSWGWGDKMRVIRKVTLADAPCKEYKSLVNYLEKYGKKKDGMYLYSLTIPNYRLFSADMGGKRGSLWDEYGERRYLDNKPKKCAETLTTLRKFRGAKDTMVCVFGEENYMDEEERRHSAYYEVECDGEKRRYLEITIKTPQGKEKCKVKIY